MNPEHELLKELTALPTAAGREDAVVGFVRAWARRRRKRVRLDEDPAGNLVLQPAEESKGDEGAGRPLWLSAHMDHPAAVVEAVDPEDPRKIRARFLGGVGLAHMQDAKVQLHRGGQRPARGRVASAARPGPEHAAAPGERADPELDVVFPRDPGAKPGQVLTWDLGGSVVRGTRLHAPACDDLGSVAAALATLDRVTRRGRGGAGGAGVPLRVLLTRAEEVGFVGAIAACRSGAVPADARVLVLECSKASPEAPIGGGVVVRVGDRSSTFDPGLTGAVAAAAGQLADETGLRWQRKLMAGGTCEATAYAAFGYEASCVCLPLGNYHNMADDEEDALAREVISLRDFDGMVALLERLPAMLGGDAPASGGGFRGRLEALHDGRASLLRPIGAG